MNRGLIRPYATAGPRLAIYHLCPDASSCTGNPDPSSCTEGLDPSSCAACVRNGWRFFESVYVETELFSSSCRVGPWLAAPEGDLFLRSRQIQKAPRTAPMTMMGIMIPRAILALVDNWDEEDASEEELVAVELVESDTVGLVAVEVVESDMEKLVPVEAAEVEVAEKVTEADDVVSVDEARTPAVAVTLGRSPRSIKVTPGAVQQSCAEQHQSFPPHETTHSPPAGFSVAMYQHSVHQST